MASSTKILTIAPYKFLPAHSGGHKGIALFHHYLGKICTDHVISTINNADNNFSFTLHKIFPDKPYRYIPRFSLSKIEKIAADNNCTHIICEHPYMSFTAIALSKKLDIPWYSHSHNIESERFKSLGKPWWPLLHKYEKYAMQKANGVFFKTVEDADWAIKNYKLSSKKCHIVPFGTEHSSIPQKNDQTKKDFAKANDIDHGKPWLYFLGALSYKPNEDAVTYIINEIAPRLKEKKIEVEILVAGKGLNETLINQIKSYNNIHHLGFVPDLKDFLNACDIMLNPVMTGGGIKTKAIEALEYNKSVISSYNGAAGISQIACGNKLLVAENYDWDAFTDNVNTAINNPIDTPDSFYEMYYWGNIAENTLKFITLH